jgi:hypothetical protein
MVSVLSEACMRSSEVGFCRQWHREPDIVRTICRWGQSAKVAICCTWLERYHGRNGCGRPLRAFLSLDHWHDVGHGVGHDVGRDVVSEDANNYANQSSTERWKFVKVES